MRIKDQIEGDELTLFLEGTFDETGSPELESRIGDILSQEPKKICVDMTGVTYISSAGIRVLIVMHKRAIKKEKRVILRNMSSKISEIIETVGILPLFTEEGIEA